MAPESNIPVSLGVKYRMIVVLPRIGLIEKIEAKYSKCKYCSKRGICKAHPTCFYCGGRD